MKSLEELRDELKELLVHLYDPNYQPGEHLYTATGRAPAEGPGAVQSAIIQMIKELEPEKGVPAGSRARRDFEVLYQRFVLKLTQEQTAERLQLSVRTVQRLQGEAVHMLATRLWEAYIAAGERNQQIDSRPMEETLVTSEVTEWVSQVRQELLSLQQGNPDAEADLRATIDGALRIARTAAARKQIIFEAEAIESNLLVKFHPSALRQVLLVAITTLKQAMPSFGSVTLKAKRVGDYVVLTVTARPTLAESPIDISLAQEFLSIQGGSIESALDGEATLLTMKLPSVYQTDERFTVLAVDDNSDLITLYQSYCTGTKYEVVPLLEGKHVFHAIEANRPNIVLLDVMLPDIDGWDLLLDLHANPKTEAIPIIVCSVVTDEQLALKLGAAKYLRKPVWREQLIAAFDQVLN